VQGFRKLKVWQRSHALAVEIYRSSTGFPSEERFGLTLQLRRAAISVPTNIAEGSKRLRRQDYARFLNIAEGSIAETEYLLMLSAELGFLPNEISESLGEKAAEVARMLNALRNRVEARTDP
jgi:four helix bundle protein